MNDCDCLYANHPQNQQQQQQVTMENGFGGQNNFTPIQNVFNDTCHTIASRIEELDQFVGRAESHMREMFEKQEDLNCLQHEYLRLKEWLDRASKKPDTKSDSTSNKFKLSLSQKESLVRAQQQQHHFLWENWQRSLDTIFKQALQIQTEVLANVDYFKMAQQWSGNGVTVDSNLDHIQSWCERLIDIWLKLLRQINLMHLQPNSDPKIPMNFSVNSTEYYNAGIYQRWRTQIEDVVGRLVKSTFIVDKQPPQVLKTNTRFPCSVRSLIGSPLGNTHGTRPMVRVTIVNETQARAIVQAEDVKDIKEASGAILNREAPMEYHPGTKQYTASFRTMTLKKIQRTEKKGTESVMDEKFALLFQSMFKVAEGELVYYVKVLSLPVVVIVHGNQENHAWATVTWDNAFASEKRVPFVVPDRVEWERVGHVLNLKFKAAVGSEMTPGDIRFLACKVFRNFDLAEYNKLHLSWAQFSKEPLPDRNFTFWEWFYSLMKLTRDHLKELWNADNRCIYGFISRKQTEEVLATKPEGTFLLRYSETELGSITIAYTTVKTDMKPSDSKPVLHIKPWGQKDFQIRPLADRIKDLKHLKYLYPDIPKDQAFGNFYEPNPVIDTSCEGYVPPVLVTHIPEWAVNGGTDSFPNTPHSSLATHSPMTDLYNDPPNSVGSVPHDVPINSSEISHFQDVDFLNLIADVDYDMDDIPTDYDQTELSGAGMNQLFVNGLS